MQRAFCHHQVAVERAVRMVSEGVVLDYIGETVPVKVDTLCIHGDNPAAPQIAAALLDPFKGAGVQNRPIAEFL